MKYRSDLAQRCRRFHVSSDIVRAAVKTVDRDKTGEEFRYRLRNSNSYDWSVVFDPKTDEVWVCAAAMWARHHYLVNKAAGTRLHSLVDLVDSW